MSVRAEARGNVSAGVTRRLTGPRRAFAPIADARGMARSMLWIGAGITLAFVLIALLAPVIAPYDFDTFQANGHRFPQLAPPSWDHLHGHQRPVDRRPLTDHLGHPDRAQGRDRVDVLLDRGRRPARAALRLLRRLARPAPRADHGRAPGVPVPPARDRDRVPARRQGWSGDPHRGDRDHGRLHPSLLPRGPKPHDLDPGGAVRRGCARARRQTVHGDPQVRLLQRGPERPAARDTERCRRDPHARRARVPRLRDPADAGRGVGLRRQPGRVRRGLGDLVDGAVPRPRDRPARDRA